VSLGVRGEKGWIPLVYFVIDSVRKLLDTPLLKAGNFLAIWVTTSFSRRTLLHVICYVALAAVTVCTVFLYEDSKMCGKVSPGAVICGLVECRHHPLLWPHISAPSSASLSPNTRFVGGLFSVEVLTHWLHVRWLCFIDNKKGFDASCNIAVLFNTECFDFVSIWKSVETICL
jgi:hypothetical protein